MVLRGEILELWSIATSQCGVFRATVIKKGYHIGFHTHVWNLSKGKNPKVFTTAYLMRGSVRPSDHQTLCPSVCPSQINIKRHKPR